MRELRQAQELQPADMGLAHQLGQALVAAGEPEASDGFRWLVHAARSPQADPGWVLEAAAAAPTPAAAEAILRDRLEAASPVPLLAHQRAALEAALATQLCRQGRSDEGRPLAEAAAAVVPHDPAVRQALALCHEGAGRHREALAVLLRDARNGGGRLAPGAPGPGGAGPGGAGGRRRLVARPRSEAPAAGGDPGVRRCGAEAPEGSLRPAHLVALGALAPDESSRRFVARALAPAEVPAGNLFGLLSWARQVAGSTRELAPLLPLAARAVEAFDRPLLVAVMGEFNAGKSSFVNALVGEPVAEVGVTPTTATINVLRHGPRGGRVLFHDGRVQELAADRDRPDAGQAGRRPGRRHPHGRDVRAARSAAAGGGGGHARAELAAARARSGRPRAF